MQRQSFTSSLLAAKRREQHGELPPRELQRLLVPVDHADLLAAINDLPTKKQAAQEVDLIPPVLVG